MLHLFSYTYDDNGNRLSHTSLSGTVFGTYDDQDRMLSYGDLSYGYTANGSLTFKAEGVDTTWYNYDNLGNLISVLLPDGTFIEYMIDGQNRRIGKLVNGEFKKGWIYQDQINPVAELDSLGQMSTRFVYGSKGHVPDYMIKGGVTYSLITDHLGSVRLVVDAAGNVVQSISYDEFGNIVSDTNPEFQPFGYAGGLVDGHTGLVLFGFRDYDAYSGRWMSKDPIGFAGGSTNFYVYVYNDPVNFADPLGLQNPINPTGGSVRGRDAYGRGGYGESRDSGARPHSGVDYSGDVGSPVFAPESGSMEVYQEGGETIIRITTQPDATGTQYSYRLLHVNTCDTAGTISQVTQGDTIGAVDDLSDRYPGITPHAHLEMYRIQGGETTRINPSDYIYAP